jgi:hypothetical protein
LKQLPRLVTATLARTVLSLLLAAPLAARAADVWVASSTEKIRPQTRAPQPLPGAAVLTAARNEFEAFQVAVTGAASGVSVTASPLSGPGTIDAPRLYREELISVWNASAADGAVGAFPDALVPDVDEFDGQKRKAFPFTVPAGETRVVFVEYQVPVGAAPGLYTGEVVVHAAGAADVRVPVSLTVHDFALPSTSSLKSFFQLFYTDLSQGHRVSGAELTALRVKYLRAGLDHRISISGVDDGNLDLDHLAQYYGPYLDGTAPTRLPGAKLTSFQYLGSNHGQDAASQVAGYARWGSYFDGRGWLDRLFDYTCDEPPLTCQWSDIAARARVVKQGDPRIRTLVTTTVQQATSNGAISAIDLLVPVVNEMNDRPGNTFAGLQRPAYDGFLASAPAKELWMYQSCMSHGCGGYVDIGNPAASDLYYTGWPSYMIDAEGVRARSMEWLSFLYKATGELYWETGWAMQNGDAWNDQYYFSGNGDGTLFYPGTPDRIGGTSHVPVSSLRLKLLREGMEDFEYLKALKEAGDPALAEAIATQLFPNGWSSPKVADLLSARELIAHRVLELTGKLAPPPGSGGGSGPGASPAPAPGPGPGPVLGTDPTQSPITPPGVAPVRAALVGSGCSAGAAAELLGSLGVLAALALRRRRAPRA